MLILEWVNGVMNDDRRPLLFDKDSIDNESTERKAAILHDDAFSPLSTWPNDRWPN